MNTSANTWVAVSIVAAALASGEPAQAGPRTYEVSTGELFLRAGPSDRARRISRLRQGERIEVSGVSGHWAKVHPTQEHWVYRGHLRRTGRRANVDTTSTGETTYRLRGRDNQRGRYTVEIHITDQTEGKVEVTRKAYYAGEVTEIHSGEAHYEAKGSQLKARLTDRKGLANALDPAKPSSWVDVDLRFQFDGRLELEDRSPRGGGAATQHLSEVAVVPYTADGGKPQADGKPESITTRRTSPLRIGQLLTDKSVTLELTSPSSEAADGAPHAFHYLLEVNDPRTQASEVRRLARLLSSWGLDVTSGLPSPQPRGPISGYGRAHARLEVWIDGPGVTKALARDRASVLAAYLHAHTVLNGTMPLWGTSAGRARIERDRSSDRPNYERERRELERALSFAGHFQGLQQARTDAERRRALGRLARFDLTSIAAITYLAPRSSLRVEASLRGRRVQIKAHDGNGSGEKAE